jgi:uncharacterized protein involved in exopolysaccharide biosynthesis
MFEDERPRREASIRDFLRVVFRYKWVLIILFFVSTLVVGAINVRSPVLYESEARVLVRRGQLENMVDARYRYLTWQEEVLSELETVKSYSVLARGREILKDKLLEEGLDREPLIARGYVQVDVVKESNVLAISYLHRDPVYVVLVADAVTEAYMEYRETTYDVAKLEDFFSEQIDDVQRQMYELRKARGELVTAENLTFSSEEKGHLESRVSDTETQLAEARHRIKIKEAVLQAERQALEDGFVTTIPRDSQSSYGANNMIIQHKLKLATLKGERDAMAAQFTEKYPPLISLNRQIEAVEADLHNEIVSKIELDEMDLKLLKEAEQELLATLTEAENKLKNLADKEGRYQQMQLDLESLEQRYMDLRKTQVQTKMSQATSPAWRVTLITPARRPVARKTKDYVRMALAPIFSLIVGLGLVFFMESLDHSIKGAADAEEAIGLPVLATLWHVKKKSP